MQQSPNVTTQTTTQTEQPTGTRVEKTTEPDTELVGFKLYQIVYYLVGILDSLLVLRLLFKLFGANPNNTFTDFIYTITRPFVTPFNGIFKAPQTSGSVFETSTLVAIIIYVLIALALAEFIKILTTRKGEFTN